MKNRLILMGSAAILALAGCSSADEKPRKGKYKPEVELRTIEFPGVTDAMKDGMRKQMETSFAGQAGAEQCIGGGKKADWKELANSLSSSMGGKCETTTDNSTDTTVDMVVACTGGQLGDMDVTMKGAAETESFSMDVDMKLKALPKPMEGEGALGMTVSAKRVGDC